MATGASAGRRLRREIDVPVSSAVVVERRRVMSTKYLLLHRSPVGTSRPRPSPAEMQEMMEQFQAWRSKFATEIVDIGDGLLRAARSVARRASPMDRSSGKGGHRRIYDRGSPHPRARRSRSPGGLMMRGPARASRSEPSPAEAADALPPHYFRHEHGRLGVRARAALHLARALRGRGTGRAAPRGRDVAEGRPDDPGAWLYRVAHHALIDALRRERRGPAGDHPFEEPPRPHRSTARPAP